MRRCGGLTLASCQVSTKLAALSLLNWMGGKISSKSPAGQDKEREVIQQLLSWAKQGGLLGSGMVYRVCF